MACQVGKDLVLISNLLSKIVPFLLNRRIGCCCRCRGRRKAAAECTGRLRVRRLLSIENGREESDELAIQVAQKLRLLGWCQVGFFGDFNQLGIEVVRHLTDCLVEVVLNLGGGFCLGGAQIVSHGVLLSGPVGPFLEGLRVGNSAHARGAELKYLSQEGYFFIGATMNTSFSLRAVPYECYRYNFPVRHATIHKSMYRSVAYWRSDGDV
ncbi:hypothetical protein D3C87_1606500 [compost metagenome]